MDRASEHLKRSLEETARENQAYWEERGGDLLLALTRCAQIRACMHRKTDMPERAASMYQYTGALSKALEIVREYYWAKRAMPELAEQMWRAEQSWV